MATQGMQMKFYGVQNATFTRVHRWLAKTMPVINKLERTIITQLCGKIQISHVIEQCYTFFGQPIGLLVPVEKNQWDMGRDKRGVLKQQKWWDLCPGEGCNKRTFEIWIGLCPGTSYNVQHWLNNDDMQVQFIISSKYSRVTGWIFFRENNV